MVAKEMPTLRVSEREKLLFRAVYRILKNENNFERVSDAK